MVGQLGDIEKIVADAAHQVAYLLIIIKAEGKLLIMLEKLGPHGMLHLGAHHVAVVGGAIGAIGFDGDQRHHHRRNDQDPLQRVRAVDDIAGDQPHQQRDDQRNAAAQGGKKHIGPKEFPMGLIIRNKLFNHVF